MIENLYEAAKERIKEELEDGSGDNCNISAIKYEIGYIENLNMLSYKIDDIDNGDTSFEDLKEFTRFIKRDEGSKDSFIEVLEAMFVFEDDEDLEECIEMIASTIFDKSKKPTLA